MRRDVLGNARTLCGIVDDPLDEARRVLVGPITLEQIALSSSGEVGAQFRRQHRQDRYIAIAAAFGLCQIHLGRYEAEVQIRHLNMHKLVDSRARVEQGLDH